MSFLRDLFYALAVGRMLGTMMRERRRREWQRRETYTRPTSPPVIRQDHGRKPR